MHCTLRVHVQYCTVYTKLETCAHNNKRWCSGTCAVIIIGVFQCTVDFCAQVRAIIIRDVAKACGKQGDSGQETTINEEVRAHMEW